MTGLNPWMHVLSEIMATEPFIIAGTSLNEVDLEFYLQHRTEITPRRGQGPSLLIEPHPTVVTRADCERHGLTLVEATFGEFMAWLQREFPSPPRVIDLLVPDAGSLFRGLTPIQLIKLFSDFELVAASDCPLSSVPGPFLYGREPEWQDLNQHVDIERADNAAIARLLAVDAASSPKLVLILDDAGTGKTTVAKRVAHSLARAGKPVLSVKTLSRIDAENAKACLAAAQSRMSV
jgi:hypothetical protein